LIIPWFIARLWIRIASRFNDFVDLDSESGSKGKKMKTKMHFLVHLLYFFFYLRGRKWYKLLVVLLSILISKTFVFKSSVLDPDLHWIRIQ
jgi:hypothetical protein